MFEPLLVEHHPDLPGKFRIIDGDLESAQLRIRPPEKKGGDGLLTDLDAAVEAMKSVPWTMLQEMKGDTDLLKRIDDAEGMLKALRKALTSE